MQTDGTADGKSILFIWGTLGKLKECLMVIRKWGYEYYGPGLPGK